MRKRRHRFKSTATFVSCHRRAHYRLQDYRYAQSQYDRIAALDTQHTPVHPVNLIPCIPLRISKTSPPPFPGTMLDLDGAISILLTKKLLGEALIKEICEKTKELLMRESNVVHISAPVTVVGDIHGSVPSLLPSYCALD